MTISQKKIAEMLGITQATVSKALHDSPRISSDLKKRVRALCDEVRYVPDFSAISLVSGRTNSISVLLPSPGRLNLSDLHSGWVSGLHGAALAGGYRLRVDHISAYERTAKERSADGFVVLGANRSLVSLTSDCPSPVVYTDCGIFQPTGVVSIDNTGGMAEAVRHLIGLGHRTIAFFGSHPVTSEVDVCLERHMGYVRALNDAGIPAAGNLTIRHAGWLPGVDAAFKYADELMAAIGSGATAVVTSSDIAAIGVIQILKRRGLSVPEDISVIGFDESLLARSWDPPLTTVMQDLEPASEQAIGLLINAIEGSGMGASQLIPAHLLIRGTTAKPK